MSINTKDVKTTTEILSGKSKDFYNVVASGGLVLNLKSHEDYDESDPLYFDITLTINFLSDTLSYELDINEADENRDFTIYPTEYKNRIISLLLVYSVNNSQEHNLFGIDLQDFYLDEDSNPISCLECANLKFLVITGFEISDQVRGTATYTKRTQIATLDKIMSKLADVYYPVGHYVITSTNTNPNNLGIKGTWQLVSKTLAPNINSLISSSFFTVNSTNFALNGFRVGTDGSRLYCTLYGYNKVALSETNVAIGTLNFNVLGTSVNSYAAYGAGYANSKNAAVLYSVADANSSTRSPAVTITDVIPRASGGTVAAQTADSYGNIFIYFPLMITSNQGLYYNDSICSEFHWLRTA